jgi:hypothetical protein
LKNQKIKLEFSIVEDESLMLSLFLILKKYTINATIAKTINVQPTIITTIKLVDNPSYLFEEIKGYMHQ